MPYAPRPANKWPDSLDEMRGGFADNLNVYKVMAHQPELLKVWSDLRRHIVIQNALGPERQEVVILRVAARLNAPYEWAHHVDRAEKLGFERARIVSVAGAPEEMTRDDALLARAVDDLLDSTRLDAERQRALHEIVGPEGVFDLLATVGFYVTLGFIVNSFDVPLDDGIEPVPIPGTDTDA